MKILRKLIIKFFVEKFGDVSEEESHETVPPVSKIVFLVLIVFIKIAKTVYWPLVILFPLESSKILSCPFWFSEIFFFTSQLRTPITTIAIVFCKNTVDGAVVNFM